jgi:hypothetical protein
VQVLDRVTPVEEVELFLTLGLTVEFRVGNVDALIGNSGQIRARCDLNAPERRRFRSPHHRVDQCPILPDLSMDGENGRWLNSISAQTDYFFFISSHR